MRLEDHLVLSRYVLHLVGAKDLEDVQAALSPVQEGPAEAGHSHFAGVLQARSGFGIPPEDMRRYDLAVMGAEERLRRARGPLSLRYFQWFSLLQSEWYLHQLAERPDGLLRDLEAWTRRLRDSRLLPADFPDFVPADLWRLAFFLATGSGKTLLMHVHLGQVRRHLLGEDPGAALRSPTPGARRFDHLLLVTPGEELSRQHLKELALSGIPAIPLLEARRDWSRYADHVKVVEIHKVVERASGDGVSVELDQLGDRNLVLVDEGHKGTGSEARTWKDRQKRLSGRGLLLEYSATFAQAVGAAGRPAREGLLREYGKAILSDYSYRYFYRDGFGKDFEVLNVANAGEDRAHELLVGGLLLFFAQHRLYALHPEAMREYRIDPPLWVFVGSSVNAVRSVHRQSQSDVATVIGFLRRFLGDADWATEAIARSLGGRSGFVDEEGKEVFGRLLETLEGTAPLDLYREVTDEVFGGRGAVEVWAIKAADGELGLRLSTPRGDRSPWFGLVSIGDVSAFRKHLHEHLGLEVRDDHIEGSLFNGISEPDSPIKLLVGSKKFIEGWSSWRVSAMSLLNIGKSQGSQVIQLFGRGVRLRGRGFTLKRSAALPGAPPWLHLLETLYVLGWNADYLAEFQRMLANEGLTRRVPVAVTAADPWPEGLAVPATPEGYDAAREEVWRLEPMDLPVRIDRRPRLSHARASRATAALAVGTAPAESTRVDFARWGSLLDWRRLHVDLLAWAEARGYGNLAIPRGVLPGILAQPGTELFLTEGEGRDPERLQAEALCLLRAYVDRFRAHREREAEGRRLVPVPLTREGARDRAMLIDGYTVSSRSPEGEPEFLRRLQAMMDDARWWRGDGNYGLPRMYVQQHLYNPLLLGSKEVDVSPPG